jgi:hypothetical protein
MDWQFQGATLLQYVDDFLLCGPTEPTISRATRVPIKLFVEAIRPPEKKLIYVALRSSLLDWFLKSKLGA